MKEIVFTGFPGFIASRLMRRVAEQETDLSAIVLKKEWEKAQREAEAILQETGVQVRLIEGDITEPGLAVSEDAKKRMARNEVVFWHLAAVYDLAVPRDIAWKVNVEGTGKVNEFLKQLPKLERYMYFSTAYVAGRREGRLYEHELIRPESFKNHYEETKFEAELLVDSLKDELPVTIIRPGIVRGHSVTGETIKFDGPYFFLNMIDRLRQLPAIPYIGRSAEFLNVVPVDYILDASVYLSRLPEAEGETVHLTDPAPHPIEEVYRAMVMGMTGRPPKGRIPKKFAQAGMNLRPVRQLLKVEKETLDYFDWPAEFDTSNAGKLLAGSGISCPDFIRTMPAMISFYEANKADDSKHIPIT
ncbi:SDR family oxidoreductase [Indiicoccus explosivorum]|uniref:SDR family oxidoreductase n=1 Tax=Indiicoccus explosivorum TaxID=1917864 RepID=UPI000B433795|nr:SDR family oxidoreductase [Indiicoccus explosivorum]